MEDRNVPAKNKRRAAPQTHTPRSKQRAPGGAFLGTYAPSRARDNMHARSSREFSFPSLSPSTSPCLSMDVSACVCRDSCLNRGSVPSPTLPHGKSGEARVPCACAILPRAATGTTHPSNVSTAPAHAEESSRGSSYKQVRAHICPYVCLPMSREQ